MKTNMKYSTITLILVLFGLITSCSNGKLEEKGFQVSTSENAETDQEDGLHGDLLQFATQPSSVLLTGVSNVRLTTIFKVNFDKRNNTTFTGSNCFHYKYDYSEGNSGNNWNGNLMPGLEAVYGYNMVNVSHYDIKENKQKNFFEKPVLIKTLYFPSFTKDTLNHKPVSRAYFIISAYDEDTNKDGFINIKDLRRLYLFDINGEKQKALIPENYSVFKSEYDQGNDFMYVFAQLDTNENGKRDDGEPIHIFWIDLKDPNKTGRLY